jgi:hypothetical protein
MPLQKGANAQFIIYEEPSYGVPPSVDPKGLALPLISATDYGLRQGLEQAPVLRGTRHNAEPAPGDKEVTGSVSVQPDVRSGAYLLRHFLGAAATTTEAPSAGLNTHEISSADVLPSLTTEKWFPQIPACFRQIGVKLNTLSMNLAASGFLVWDLGLLGLDEIAPVPTTRLDTTPLVYPAQGFRLPQLVLSEGGNQITYATALSISLDNGIAGIRTLGNLGRYAELPEGMVGVSGTLEVIFKDLVLFNKAMEMTKSSLVVTFPSTATPAGQSLALLFDEVMYSISSPGIPGAAGIVASLDFIAFVETGTSSARATVINDLATIAAIP